LKLPPKNEEANLRFKFGGLPDQDSECLVDMYIEMPYRCIQSYLNDVCVEDEDIICDIVSITYKDGNSWKELPLTHLTGWDITNVNQEALKLYAGMKQEEEDVGQYSY